MISQNSITPHTTMIASINSWFKENRPMKIYFYSVTLVSCFSVFFVLEVTGLSDNFSCILVLKFVAFETADTKAGFQERPRHREAFKLAADITQKVFE